MSWVSRSTTIVAPMSRASGVKSLWKSCLLRRCRPGLRLSSRPRKQSGDWCQAESRRPTTLVGSSKSGSKPPLVPLCRSGRSSYRHSRRSSILTSRNRFQTRPRNMSLRCHPFRRHSRRSRRGRSFVRAKRPRLVRRCCHPSDRDDPCRAEGLESLVFPCIPVSPCGPTPGALLVFRLAPRAVRRLVPPTGSRRPAGLSCGPFQAAALRRRDIRPRPPSPPSRRKPAAGRGTALRVARGTRIVV